jgi:hypothetical protein
MGGWGGGGVERGVGGGGIGVGGIWLRRLGCGGKGRGLRVGGWVEAGLKPRIHCGLKFEFCFRVRV